MVVSPHSKAAGFQVHRPGTTLKELPPSALFEEDKPTMELSVYAIERREATDHSMWAYLTYEKNGFEPMGDKELEPYDSLVGIKVEARPELVTLMSKIDRLNPEWPKNLFAQKGLIWSVDPEEKIDETDSLEKKNYAAMGRNFISPEGIATLFLGNQPSNRLFNQGSFIPVERFISDLHFAPNRDTIV